MDDPRLILIAGLSALAALASLVGLFSLIRRRRKTRAQPKGGGEHGRGSERERDSLPYRRVEALLGPSERALYAALRPAAVAQGADVFAKVRLADVLQVRNGAADQQALRARIGACSLGFLLCDRERLVPLLALEIDGANTGDAAFVEQALADVGLPLVHVPSKSRYDPDAIAALVRDEIARTSSGAAPGVLDEAGVPEPTSAVARHGGQAPALTASWLDPGLPAEGEADGGTGAPGPDGGEAAPPQAAAEGGPAAADAPAPDVEEPATASQSAADAHTPDVEKPAEPAADGPEPAEAAAEPTAPADAPPQAEAAADEPRCPACGQPLVEMQDLETGVVVLACSRYPECPHVQAR